MAGTATVTVTPSKRFGDDDENLSIADLNQAAMPIMQLDTGSVGSVEFITQDVIDMLTEEQRGLATSYTFPVDYSLPYDGASLSIVKVAAPGVRPGDPIWCSQIAGMSVMMDAQVDAINQVNFRGLPVGPGVVIPANTTITALVFTNKRITPRGDPGGPVNQITTDTGYLNLKSGFGFAIPAPGQMSAGITTSELDLIASGVTATVRPASVGRREIDPLSLGKLAAPVLSGQPFGISWPGKETLVGLGGVSLPHTFTATGAADGQVVVMGNRAQIGYDPLKFYGVATTNQVAIYAINLTNINQLINSGQRLKGRLL